LYCEGKKTEPSYFGALRAVCRHALIDIAPETGVPMTRAAAASRRARQLRRRAGSSARDTFEDNDEVWAVFDRDEHPNHDAAVALCARSGVRVARSNPCFEVWLILHRADYDKPDGRQVAQGYLRSLCPEYDPNAGKTPDCSALVLSIAAAEARAEALLRRREQEGAPFGSPSTTVFLLTRAIREAAEATR